MAHFDVSCILSKICLTNYVRHSDLFSGFYLKIDLLIDNNFFIL